MAGGCNSCISSTDFITSNQCVTCATGCSTCNTTNNCLTCSNSGDTPTIAGCLPCAPGCSTCSNVGGCTACKNSAAFKTANGCFTCGKGCSECSNNGGCSKCTDNSFYPEIDATKSTGECLECLKFCDRCLDGSSCEKCKAGFTLTSLRICASDNPTFTTIPIPPKTFKKNRLTFKLSIADGDVNLSLLESTENPFEVKLIPRNLRSSGNRRILQN